MYCGYFKNVNGKRYGPYFRRKDNKREFTAKDITRIMTHARVHHGITDAELLSAWSQSTNNVNFLCALSKVLQLANLNIILGACIVLIKGGLTLLKGLKILVSGKKSSIATSFLEFIVPKKYWEELGGILLFIGSGEIIGASVMIFIQNIIDDQIMRELVYAACKNEKYDLKITNSEAGKLDGFQHALQQIELDYLDGDDKQYWNISETPLAIRNILNFGEPSLLQLLLEDLERKKVLDEVLSGQYKIVPDDTDTVPIEPII